jgi:hypothetical protein
MKPATLVIGLAPLVLFTALDRRRPAADAAAIAAMAALAAVVVMARSAVPVLPIVQALTLAVISVIAFTSDTATHQFVPAMGAASPHCRSRRSCLSRSPSRPSPPPSHAPTFRASAGATPASSP